MGMVGDNAKDSLLPQSIMEEIWIAFDAFDNDRLGRLSTQTATIVCLALGVRVTEEQVATGMRSILAVSENKGAQQQLDSDDDDYIIVTFDMMCRFLQDKVRLFLSFYVHALERMSLLLMRQPFFCGFYLLHLKYRNTLAD